MPKAEESNNNLTVDATLMSLLALIGLAAAVTNFRVVACVYRNKNLRTPLDKAIASLAMADIITGLFVVPAIILIYKTGYFMSGPVSYWKIQLIWSVVDVFTCLSVWHVLFITLDRYVAVIYPGKYSNIVKLKRCSWFLFATAWLIPCILMVVLFFASANGGDMEPYTPTTLELVYVGFMIYMVHGIPILLIFILNIRLLKFIHSNRKSCNVDLDVGITLYKTVNNVKGTALVAACLIVAYVPYLVKWQLEVWEQLSPPQYKIDPYISMGIHMVLALNSVANPVIYAFQMPAYWDMNLLGNRGREDRRPSDRTMRL